jgi:hypothetical protein
MVVNNKHDAWLKFARDILNVTVGRSKADLIKFRDIAFSDYRALLPIIDEYVRLAQNSDSDVDLPRAPRRKSTGPKQMHLFDLLREKTFFPQNLDLARFASRVLPSLRNYRFDKMSRGNIAARIIEFIESDPKTKETLERSMREALEDLSGRPHEESERNSFLSKWERIIKGDEADQ